MGFQITGTVFWAECECPRCGHSFQYEDEGTSYVSEMYKLDEVRCPECDLWFNEDGDFEEDEEEDDDEDEEENI